MTDDELRRMRQGADQRGDSVGLRHRFDAEVQNIDVMGQAEVGTKMGYTLRLI